MRFCASGGRFLPGLSYRCHVWYAKLVYVGLNRHQPPPVLLVDHVHKPCGVNSQFAQPGIPLGGPRVSVFTSTSGDAGDGYCRAPRYERNLSGGNCSHACEEGDLTEAVDVLDLLLQRGEHVDSYLFYSALKRCIAQKNLILGRRVHALTCKSGHDSNTFLANQIISMYALHGQLEEATKAFSKVDAPNAHVWASIILAHARHGQPSQAIKLYLLMRESTVKPDNHVFVAALKSCAAAGDLPAGKEVHADVLRSSEKPNEFVGNGLVDMYAKCGSIRDARRVFDTLPSRNVVTWTTLMAGYAQNGLCQEALALFKVMQQHGVTPNHVTVACLLKACGSIRALHEGKQLHSWIQERGLGTDLVVGNCLVDMYAKCGNLECARRVFENLPKKNVVTWTAIIAGYARNGLAQEALALYASMQHDGRTPANHMTFSCLLQACASVGAIHQGKQLHGQILERGLEGDVVIGNCLVGMYSKCGRIKDARKVFDQLPSKDVVSWTAMLNGYAQQGDSEMAIRCFEDMQQQGVKPDSTSFVCLLAACSHDGLVNEGSRYFKMMEEEYGFAPTVYHHICMVDLLGRAGRLDEAESMLLNPPCQNNIVGWTSLLSACKSHSNPGLARRCFDHLVELEPEDATSYILLGNVYANAGRWSDVDEIEKLRKLAGASKKAGKAYIDLEDKVHEFTVGDDKADISSKLRSTSMKLKEGGHSPHTELVLKAVPEQAKEDALCGHAEKLALAYGLLNTPDGATLLVTKNLRMCNDCHSSTKIMSLLEKRKIVVRDAHRVHLFLDGSCSCGDRH